MYNSRFDLLKDSWTAVRDIAKMMSIATRLGQALLYI